MIAINMSSRICCNIVAYAIYNNDLEDIFRENSVAIPVFFSKSFESMLYMFINLSFP